LKPFGEVITNLKNAICFTAGTKFLTKNGLKNIEDISVGDSAWSFNEFTGEKSLKKVVALSKKVSIQLVQLEIGNETIWTTPEHPFWVNNRWKNASQIAEADSVFLFSGYKYVVKRRTFIDSTAVVYNFTIDQFHTYFVSSNSILVHNSCEISTKKAAEFKLLHTESTITNSSQYKAIQKLSDEDLIRSVYNPKDGKLVTVNSETGLTVDGNTRIYEIQRRKLDIEIPYQTYIPDNSMFIQLKEPPPKK